MSAPKTEARPTPEGVPLRPIDETYAYRLGALAMAARMFLITEGAPSERRTLERLVSRELDDLESRPRDVEDASRALARERYRTKNCGPEEGGSR